jgi:hypothetical protein
MPRMDNLDFLEGHQVQSSVDSELELGNNNENETNFKTLEDDNTDSSTNEDTHNRCSSHTCVNISRQTSIANETNSRSTYNSSCGPKTLSVDIETKCCADSDSVYLVGPRSLPSPLPSHFADENDLFNEETRRKSIADLSSTQGSNKKRNDRIREEEAGSRSIEYTSLESEIRKLSKTEQTQKKVLRLGLKNRRGTFSKKDKEQIKGKRLSTFGIHEEVFECCLGEWILTDLDLNVFEIEQARDIRYLREKRKQRRFTICGRCWII